MRAGRLPSPGVLVYVCRPPPLSRTPCVCSGRHPSPVLPVCERPPRPRTLRPLVGRVSTIRLMRSEVLNPYDKALREPSALGTVQTVRRCVRVAAPSA